MAATRKLGDSTSSPIYYRKKVPLYKRESKLLESASAGCFAVVVLCSRCGGGRYGNVLQRKTGSRESRLSFGTKVHYPIIQQFICSSL